MYAASKGDSYISITASKLYNLACYRTHLGYALSRHMSVWGCAVWDVVIDDQISKLWLWNQSGFDSHHSLWSLRYHYSICPSLIVAGESWMAMWSWRSLQRSWKRHVLPLLKVARWPRTLLSWSMVPSKFWSHLTLVSGFSVPLLLETFQETLMFCIHSCLNS